MKIDRVLPMGFDDETFDEDMQQLYTGVPYPGTRVVVWANRAERENGVCALNLYFDPPIPRSCGNYGIAYAPNRCLRDQNPIAIEYSPLALQANILHLVERYKATLPTEVTNEEA